MVARGSRRIIGRSSKAAVQCYSFQSAYNAGKRGMDGILRALAHAVALGVS